MAGAAYPLEKGDGPLWVAALGLSLLLNTLILAVVGVVALRSATMVRQAPPPAPPRDEEVATIFAELAKPAEAATPTKDAASRRFARTSDDQVAEAVDKPAFFGERNTRATSDRAPDANAPPLPSQAGIKPRYEDEIETTESRYQDGGLDGSDRPAATPEQNPAPPQPVVGQAEAMAGTAAETAVKTTPPTERPGTADERSLPPARETLLNGPNPVDVPVPRQTQTEEQPKPAAEPRPQPDAAEQEKPATKPAEAAEAPKPKPASEPAFKGYQRKTAVVGSISRNGRSALDVEDTPLGRYQAAISRAVEQEWQRNCVRHRDFITPGFLTVRFFVEPSGKVRSVQFVGDMETGEVQKGFTLNSIRDAGIPAMPPVLRKEHEKEPLELIFRFYF